MAYWGPFGASTDVDQGCVGDDVGCVPGKGAWRCCAALLCAALCAVVRALPRNGVSERDGHMQGQSGVGKP